MVRDYVINGECLVRVKFGDHMQSIPLISQLISGFSFSGVTPVIVELGLASESIRIVPRWQHKDIHADDFGPLVPAEMLWQGGTCDIFMTLVHYDPTVLRACISEAQGGNPQLDVFGTANEGNLTPFGSTLGHGLPLYNSGNHHIGLELSSPVLGLPYTFAACHLTGPPMVLPLGTERTLVQCNWRAIPYVPATTTSGTIIVTSGSMLSGAVVSGTVSIPSDPMEVLSSGVLLWDHIADAVP